MSSALLLLMAQAAPLTTVVVPVDDDLAHFDLARVRPRAQCDAALPASSEIVVCGRKANDAPVDDDLYRAPPFEARFRFAGADARAVAVERSLPGGISAPAAMINFKWKF